MNVAAPISILTFNGVKLTHDRILAALLAVLGLAGFVLLAVLSIRQLIESSFTGTVDNPMYINPQRLTSKRAFEILRGDFTSELWQIGAFTVLILALTVQYLNTLRLTFRHSMRWSVMASVFLGCSTMAGILIGPALLLVITFAFQSQEAGASQQEWMRTGIPFLVQFHLIYVYAWLFCMAIGWVCLGQALKQPSGQADKFAAMLVVAGVTIVLSLIVRSTLPLFAAKAPAFIVVFGRLFGLGAGLGLFALGASYLKLSSERHDKL